MKFLCLPICLFLTVMALGQDSSIVETIRSNTFLISASEGRLAGNGVPLIEEAVRDHQFVLIGEMHGIREVGAFSEGIFRIGKKHGYRYFALETDPWIARKLESLASRPIDSMAAFVQRMPLTIPFYGNRDDFSFLASIVENADGSGRRIWGLDQTFAAATRYLLYEIMEKAKSDKARKLAEKHYQQALSAFTFAMEKKDPGSVYLTKMKEADFRELEEAFHEDQNFEALEIISGMKKSKEIYQHWYDGEYYQNNRVRSRWMKNTFARYYNEAMFRDGELPKVMFKFGSNHAVRGLTPMHIYDLGNMVSELAESRGNQSLHILFSALKGTAHNMLAGSREFDSTDDIDPRIMEAIGEYLSRDDWILIDMRPLRKLSMKNQPDSFKALVFGFDFYILVPEAHAFQPY